MKWFLIPLDKLKANDVAENVLNPSKIDFLKHCISTTVVKSVKSDSKPTNSDDFLNLTFLI